MILKVIKYPGFIITLRDGVTDNDLSETMLFHKLLELVFAYNLIFIFYFCLERFEDSFHAIQYAKRESPAVQVGWNFARLTVYPFPMKTHPKLTEAPP